MELIRALAIAAAAAAALLLAVPTAFGLETDQHYAWGYELADATEVVNAKFNLELELAVRRINARPDPGSASCQDVARQLRRQLHFVIFQDLEVWALNSELLPRLPATAEEEARYRSSNLYHIHPRLDFASWLPTVPTIEVNGIRFGTDKLAHVVSSGWRWHDNYLRALKRGLSPAEAEAVTIRDGIFWERTGLGGMASGVTSQGDLEAGYQGMRFYDQLCRGDAPTLMLTDGYWRVRRPFDIRLLVSPEWDESYQPPWYTRARWRRVRPTLLGYCERRALPSVVARQRYYHSLDRVTPVDAMIEALVAEGRLEDPQQFSLDANCPDAAAVPDAGAEAPEPERPPTSAGPNRELIDQLARRGSDLEHRYVGLLGLGLAHPEVVNGSIGVLLAEVPAEYPCTTVCHFQGPLLQLQAGVGGGRLSAGWARVLGPKPRDRAFLTDVHIGFGFKGSLLRTWGDGSHSPSDQTFLGGEFEITVVRVNFRAGIFYRLDGDEGSARWLPAGGIGWGF